MIEKSNLAHTREVYVYAPPLKGMIAFEMAPDHLPDLRGKNKEKRVIRKERDNENVDKQKGSRKREREDKVLVSPEFSKGFGQGTVSDIF